jgi:glycosyltransferase involved in cell wall biosynthesis
LECLASLELQTIKPFEVVITDDSIGSNIGEFIEKIESDYSFPIRYLTNHTAQGIAANSNFGIHTTKGEIVHVLHQDDFILSPHLYADVGIFFLNSEISWALVGNSSHHLRGRIALDKTLCLGFNNIGGPSALFFRKSVGVVYDEAFSLLVDVVLMEDLRRLCGEPFFMPGRQVHLRVGDHQHQHQISADETRVEVRQAIKRFGFSVDSVREIRRNIGNFPLQKITYSELCAENYISHIRKMYLTTEGFLCYSFRRLLVTASSPVKKVLSVFLQPLRTKS